MLGGGVEGRGGEGKMACLSCWRAVGLCSATDVSSASNGHTSALGDLTQRQEGRVRHDVLISVCM